MAKFQVRVIKEVWEQAEFVVEADDETAAEACALLRAQSGEAQQWRWAETSSYDVIVY